MNQAIVALSVAVIGLSVVVLALVVLLSRSRASKSVEPAPAAQPQAPVAYGSGSAAQGIPQEVVAAISAAITAVWQGETGFVIRHIKRINNAPAWNQAGREEQIYSRF